MKKLIIAFALFASSAFAEDRAFAPQGEATTAQLTKAFEVSFDDAEEAVTNALHAKGIGDKLAVTMNGRRSGALFAHTQPVTVETKGLTIEKIDHRWSASLLFMSNGEVISALPASGHFDEIVEIPVLKRQIRAGDIISQNDIEIRDFSQTHVRTDTVTDMASLIGKAPIHTMSPSRPIREHEIAQPTLVKKNSLVDMHFRSPGMEISATGEAMSDGAHGDVINVRNTASKKIVRASIVDSKTVTILVPGTETSQLTGNTYGTN